MTDREIEALEAYKFIHGDVWKKARERVSASIFEAWKKELDAKKREELWLLFTAIQRVEVEIISLASDVMMKDDDQTKAL